ncbi:thiamine pyrophosphate-dependent enzyme [Streptomyces nanshensis]|uniref:thiamine pyrophosphate-dependent enzyme n=1 Tax=Streptomyces nanshensis TaxID=518642 RepID=UPI0009A01458|nr:thiamine pyrophosphate-dependent enzyme [Streptomyces nanshensis]
MSDSAPGTGPALVAVPEGTAGIGADAVADQLVAGGVSTVFGVPGVQLDYAVDAFARRAGSLRYLSCRHEQGAAHMADGYARAGGGTGVFAVVPGPGVLNAMTGLATAYACSSPVLCLAANLPAWAIDGGLGLLHEIRDQEEVLRSVTKRVLPVRDADGLAAAVRDGLAAARDGRPQPVAVSVPEDLLKQPAGAFPLPVPGDVRRVAPDAGAVAEAARLLASAERPVVLCGGGVVAAGATEALGELATTLRAPVVTTSNGRGALSDRHPWTLTSLGGRDVVPRADVVLIVGSRGVRMDGTPLAPGAETVLLNADPADLGTPHEPAVALLGDAHLGLDALTAELGRCRSAWTPGDVTAVRTRCGEQIAGIGELADWVGALRDGMADEDVLVGELTQVSYLSRVAFPVYAPRTFLSPGYQGTLGYGIPTAVGAQVARPDVRVVSVSGDGGFAYGMAELLTAVTHRVPVTFVVFDDGAFGNVLRTQVEQFDGRTLGTRLHNPDFADLGRIFGLDSSRAASPQQLTGMLKDAAAADRPTLVSVPVGTFPDPGPLVREGSHAPQN